MKRVLLILLALTLLLTTGLFGCSPAQPGDSTPDPEPAEEETGNAEAEPAEEEEKVLKIAINAEPEGMDTTLHFTPMVATTTYGVMEPLVRATPEGLQPGMAEDWDISEDGLTYTFYLRDAEWSDGQPVTANEYRDGLIRMFDPNLPTHYGHLAYLFENGREYNEGEGSAEDVGITVIDDKTIEYKLVEPIGHFLNFTAWTGFMPIRIDMVEAHGEAYGTSAETMAYNGPFILDEWRHEEVILLSKNPDYWDADSINLDKVEIHIIPDSNTRANLYEAGDLHFVDLERAQIEVYRDHPDLHRFATGAIWFLMFRMEDELENKNLLKALGHAIDRNTIANEVLGGSVIPANRYVPEPIPGVNKAYTEEHPDVAYYSLDADLEKAEEHLSLALEELGLDSVDQLPTFDFLADERDQNRLMAELLQDVWRSALDIETNIVLKPVKQKYDDERVGAYNINWTGWGPDFSDPMGYLYAWETGANYSNTTFSSDEYDALLRQINTTTDPVERGQLMADAEQLLLADGVFSPIYWSNQPYLLSPNVEGFTRIIANMQNNYIYADIVE